jgi:hypothetical protein
MPEHDDVAAAAAVLGLPMKVVLARAGAAAGALLDATGPAGGAVSGSGGGPR